MKALLPKFDQFFSNKEFFPFSMVTTLLLLPCSFPSSSSDDTSIFSSTYARGSVKSVDVDASRKGSSPPNFCFNFLFLHIFSPTFTYQPTFPTFLRIEIQRPRSIQRAVATLLQWLSCLSCSGRSERCKVVKRREW